MHDGSTRAPASRDGARSTSAGSRTSSATSTAPRSNARRFFALHEGATGVDGCTIYKVEAATGTGYAEQHAARSRPRWPLNPGAYADLWRFVLDVDLVTSEDGVEPACRRAALPPDARAPTPARHDVRQPVGAARRRPARAAAAGRYAAARPRSSSRSPTRSARGTRAGTRSRPSGRAAIVSVDDRRRPTSACSASDLGAAYLGGIVVPAAATRGSRRAARAARARASRRDVRLGPGARGPRTTSEDGISRRSRGPPATRPSAPIATRQDVARGSAGSVRSRGAPRRRAPPSPSPSATRPAGAPTTVTTASPRPPSSTALATIAVPVVARNT